jgi:hypothetical protein
MSQIGDGHSVAFCGIVRMFEERFWNPYKEKIFG